MKMGVRCFRCSKQCETRQRSQGYPGGLGRPQLEEDPLVVPQQDAKGSGWDIGGEEKACIAGGGCFGGKGEEG